MLILFWAEMTYQTKGQLFIRFHQFCFFNNKLFLRTPILKLHIILFKAPSLYDSFWAFQNFCSRQKCRIFYQFFMNAFDKPFLSRDGLSNNPVTLCVVLLFFDIISVLAIQNTRVTCHFKVEVSNFLKRKFWVPPWHLVVPK